MRQETSLSHRNFAASHLRVKPYFVLNCNGCKKNRINACSNGIAKSPNHDYSRATSARQKGYALITQKSHLNGLVREGDEGGILKGLGGKEYSGVDIFLHKSGILRQDLLHGAAVSKESQDVLHGEPGAPDDGFAYHYFGIYGNPFEQIFIIHEDAIGCSFDINVRIDHGENSWAVELIRCGYQSCKVSSEFL